VRLPQGKGSVTVSWRSLNWLQVRAIRKRYPEAKSIHGNETRKARNQRTEDIYRLRILEELAHSLIIMRGPRIRERKNIRCDAGFLITPPNWFAYTL
jgi:hypothetical protein